MPVETNLIETLEDLVEIVGKKLHHYHSFRRELDQLKASQLTRRVPDASPSAERTPNDINPKN